MANVSNGLTEKMMSFCREYVSNGGNGTKAYMTAYDSKSETSAGIEASRLLKRDDIKEYIAALNKPLNKKAISDRQKKIDIIWTELENARKQNDHTAIARYLDILNKMQGEYKDQTTVNDNKTVVNTLDIETLRELTKK